MNTLIRLSVLSRRSRTFTNSSWTCLFAPPTAELDYTVTYQDSCHLGNAQRITSAPASDTECAIPGVEFVELPGAGRCCGAGGTYTITERDFSLRVLGSKMDAFETTGADVLATANPGCLLQLQYGVNDRGLSADVKYVTDLLDEAYQLEDRTSGASLRN